MQSLSICEEEFLGKCEFKYAFSDGSCKFRLVMVVICATLQSVLTGWIMVCGRGAVMISQGRPTFPQGDVDEHYSAGYGL